MSDPEINVGAAFFVMGNIVYHATDDIAPQDNSLIVHPRAHLTYHKACGIGYGLLFGVIGIMAAKITEPKYNGIIVGTSVFWLLGRLLFRRIKEDEKK